MFDKGKILEIKQAAGIPTYKQRLPDLKRLGNEYRATCPFHNDRHPSLAVYEKNGTWLWRCMSHPDTCGSGDILELVKRLAERRGGNASFPAVMKAVADESGVSGVSGPTGPKAASKAAPQIEFHPGKAVEDLQSDAEAQKYLEGRGLNREVATAAKIGVWTYPGIGRAISIPYGDGVVKFRALHPKDKGSKFRHIKGKPSVDQLYGLDAVLSDVKFAYCPEVWITESELDSLTMRSHGINAISVSSATAVLNHDGTLKIRPEQMERLAKVKRIFLAMDQDEAGEKCAMAFQRVHPPDKTYRIKWDYTKGAGQPKDIGEVYKQNPEKFKERLQELCRAALDGPPEWRKLFHSIDEMEEGDIKFMITGILPEGTTFIGGLSGVGKTWFALSMAKALTRGQPFLGRFEVPEPVNVLYLIPESGEKAFRKRCERMGIEKSRFLCRTLKDESINLDDPRLLEAVAALHPVVFLDTAIRFSQAESENDSNANSRGLAAAVGKLRNAGAQAVIGLHHSPKTAANQELTLENTLRGTGDLGAMCDMVYGVKCLRAEDLELKIRCVKARDCEPCATFRIKGRPFINETGDFGQFVEEHDVAQIERQKAHADEAAKVAEMISENPEAGVRGIAKELHISVNRITGLAKDAGWIKENGKWVQTTQAALVQ